MRDVEGQAQAEKSSKRKRRKEKKKKEKVNKDQEIKKESQLGRHTLAAGAVEQRSRDQEGELIERTQLCS